MNSMRRALEDLWKERLGIARTRYQLAIRQSSLLLDEHFCWTSRRAGSPLSQMGHSLTARR
jgi:hypothetical protein